MADSVEIAESAFIASPFRPSWSIVRSIATPAVSCCLIFLLLSLCVATTGSLESRLKSLNVVELLVELKLSLDVFEDVVC